jgi:hypothetical protein
MATNEELRYKLAVSVFNRYWKYIKSIREWYFKPGESVMQEMMTKKFILLNMFLEAIANSNKQKIEYLFNVYPLFEKEYAIPKQKCILLILQDRGVV